MTATLNGCGTKLYGQCDWRSDSSHQTTEWIVLVYFPVIPLKSLRIRKVGGNRYQILEKLPLCMSQVGRVYAFALANVALISFLFPGVLALESSTLAGPVKIVLALLMLAAMCAPLGWLIRSRRQAVAAVMRAPAGPR